MGGAGSKTAKKKGQQEEVKDDSMFGFDFDSTDDLQDELEVRVSDAMQQADAATRKRCIGCLDALFYDYLLEVSPNKEELKGAYEAAKGVIRGSDYGPPYEDDRNMDLLAEVFDVPADLTLVHSFLAQKADPNFTTEDYNFNTSLHWCCFNAHDTCLPMLLKAGADVNALNKLHQTPLMLAASGRSRRHVSMVRALLRHGAEVNVKDKAGNTALINSVLAMTTEHTLEIVKLLLRHGAEIYHKPRYLTIPDPDPVAILGERIRERENLQLLEGHAIVKPPRALRSPDEKLYDLLRVRMEIAKRRAELADEARAAAERETSGRGTRVEQRQRRNDAKKRRALARVQAREQEQWEAMRRAVVTSVEEEARANFGPKKPRNEDQGKEWTKERGMAWKVRTGRQRHVSESEERLANFSQKLRDFKDKADRDAAAHRTKAVATLQSPSSGHHPHERVGKGD